MMVLSVACSATVHRRFTPIKPPGLWSCTSLQNTSLHHFLYDRLQSRWQWTSNNVFLYYWQVPYLADITCLGVWGVALSMQENGWTGTPLRHCAVVTNHTFLCFLGEKKHSRVWDLRQAADWQRGYYFCDTLIGKKKKENQHLSVLNWTALPFPFTLL